MSLGSAKCISQQVPFFSGSRALFMGTASIFFNKNNYKTRSHGTIHTLKNYFITVFSIFSFQFSTINYIQTDPYTNNLLLQI